MDKTAVIESALALRVEERLEIAEVLWNSVIDQEIDLPMMDEQKAELETRAQEHQMNPSAGSNWEDVKARLLARQ